MRHLLLLLLPAVALAQESKLRLVRESEALTPVQEQAALHVPEGFEVQLFASEPMINKPINIAFDARGRLWVSSTVEYPYAATKDRWADPQGSRVKDSRDAIKILEDTDGDGKADKVTDFADGLNIPTGVLPWHKPEHKDGCIAWSIPNIWYFADTDGDGKADLREVLFGPLGYEKDTHGMCSSFRLGLDGWVYATHGFNNTSHLKAKDGSTLDLHSGNVFRFRPDGARVELYSAGQVNPFGLCWDRYNNLYSADCHSNPITQLIRGAHYPSFGKPHDGLGYAPVMCEHSHGSTGLCGVLYIDGGVWGPEWNDHMLVGNCVTSTVNHDLVTFTGSTPKANEKPDFLTSDDPWFRPVDLQLGPDNALYIADFYNKIIGHYEVPLDHPGRDKERGRIWRVVKKNHIAKNTDLSKLDARGLAAEMGNPNLTRRRLALGEVKLRGTKEWAPAFVDLLDDDGKRVRLMGDLRPPGYPDSDDLPQDADGGIWTKRNLSTAYALWACAYLGERFIPFAVNRGRLSNDQWSSRESEVKGAADEDNKGLLQAHAVQVMGSHERLHSWEKFGIHRVFDHYGSSAGIAACSVILSHPDYMEGGDLWRAFSVADVIRQCDELMSATDPKASDPWLRPGDTQYSHSLRVLLRHLLMQDGVLHNLTRKDGTTGYERQPEQPWFMEVIRSVPTADAAAYSFAHLKDGAVSDVNVWRHIARSGDDATLAAALTKARQQTQNSLPAQSEILLAMYNALLERGSKPPAALLAWATDVAESILAQGKDRESAWTNIATQGSESPWCLQLRKCADGVQATVLSSLNSTLKGPEKLTGILRSQPFAAPAKLSFWLCGHQGFPASPANHHNLVRLIDDQGKGLREATPPRNDVARQIEWDLADIKGKLVRFELVDGDTGGAYAWLAAGRFEPAVLSTDTFDAADSRQKQLKNLATILRTTAPIGLRDRLSAFVPKPPAIAKAKPQPEIDALLKARVADYAKATPDAAKGEALFAVNCAACHTLGGKGGLIGPQLDGIGNRGSARLIEDILDPNRNVDAHFHLHQLKLHDGSTATGFVRGEVGQLTLLVDALGNEQRIAKGDIAEDTDLPQSLMPPTFGQTIPAAAFNDLIAWLLKK